MYEMCVLVGNFWCERSLKTLKFPTKCVILDCLSGKKEK